jgi:hypothetical protein
MDDAYKNQRVPFPPVYDTGRPRKSCGCTAGNDRIP